MGQHHVAGGVGQGQLGGFGKAAAQAFLQFSQITQVGAAQKQQRQHQQRAHPEEGQATIEQARGAQAEEQPARQGHAQRLIKALGQRVRRQPLRRGQRLKQHQKHGVEHGAAQHFEQQIQPAVEGQLPRLRVAAGHFVAAKHGQRHQRHHRQQPQRPLHAVALQGLPAHQQFEERGRQVRGGQQPAHRLHHVVGLVKLVLYVQEKHVLYRRNHGCDGHQAQAHGQYQLAAAEQLLHQFLWGPRHRPHRPGGGLHYVRAEGGAQRE